MKIQKQKIKVIAGFLAGMLIAGGIGAFAEYKYMATDIKYTNEKSVAQALNELYANKKNTSDETKNITTNGNQTLDKYYKNLNVNVPVPNGYIQPSGTQNITANGTYDISSKASVNVNVTTPVEGMGTTWNEGTLNVTEAGTFNINVGFLPSYFCIIRTDNSSYFCMTYNKKYSTTKMITIESAGLLAFDFGTRNGSSIMSIGENVSVRSNANMSWKWFAIK